MGGNRESGNGALNQSLPLWEVGDHDASPVLTRAAPLRSGTSSRFTMRATNLFPLRHVCHVDPRAHHVVESCSNGFERSLNVRYCLHRVRCRGHAHGRDGADLGTYRRSRSGICGRSRHRASINLSPSIRMSDVPRPARARSRRRRANPDCGMPRSDVCRFAPTQCSPT